MSKQNSSKKKNESAAGWIIAAVIIFLFDILGDMDGSVDGSIIISLIVIIAVMAAMVAVVAKIIKAVKKTAGKNDSSFSTDVKKRMSMHTQNTELFKKKSGTGRRSVPTASVHTPPPQRKFYDENAERANFERDKQRRLEQLDEFLKNGVIGKDEYKILRRRYENNI